ncbi:MAG: c-type cytochrome [Planctomycetaceae bacterium]|nr:c-type cytochrome [Planctomycetaceae bacterium]
MNFILLTSSLLAITAPPEAFQAQVRKTEPLTAHEQQATFHLPEGFEIQLFAAEPDIQKPMNLAFDARGRLWLSGSVEYPYSAQDHSGRDAIKILEDTNGDGTADKITTFADGLNIPMGLYPYKNGVIAYSIPNIYYFEDTDGDDKADQRHILYGPLGEPRDTHGMQNAFRRGFDGWLYINHGFSNTSTIQGSDGSSISLNSGNTYRIQVDGTTVEQYTWGQVNPFGSTWTSEGDLITTDCHSKPLTLLMRDGFYSSFGKAHDGLGYAPELTQHHHGSTGLAGAAYSSQIAFPKQFQQSLFLGNVVTSRIHRDTIAYTGSSPRAVEQSDFITTDDPWFRPVDVRFGPDGALYIADFYNRIIGHYEVPLDHAGRDRHRGRIWRVVYRDNGLSGPAIAPRLDQASAAELVQTLGDANLTVRMMAMDQLTDRIGNESVTALRQAVTNSDSPILASHAAWTLMRLKALSDAELVSLLKSTDRHRRIHGLKILAESDHSSTALLACLIDGLTDQDPRLRRTAAETAAQRADLSVTQELLGQLTTMQENSKDDLFLEHALKIALRNQLRSKANFQKLQELTLSPQDQKTVIDVALAIPTTHAAAAILDHLRQSPQSLKPEYLAHITRHLPINRSTELVGLIQNQDDLDISLQADLFQAVQGAIEQRGELRPAAVNAWGQELAKQLLNSTNDGPSTWQSVGKDQPWNLEPRTSANGTQQIFLSSLPGGETKKGVLRSNQFRLPAKLTFEICGHRGPPNEPASDENFVRLVTLDDSQTIRLAYPPRNDAAQRIEWELAEHKGKIAVLEIVDGLNVKAFAWLAIANIDPPLISIPVVAPLQQAERKIAAVKIAEQLQLTQLADELRQLVVERNTWPVRAAAARALAKMPASISASFLIPLLDEDTVSSPIREQICTILTEDDSTNELLKSLFRRLPLRHQLTAAQQMALNSENATQLLSMIDGGVASRQLLQNPTVHERMAATVDPEDQARIEAMLNDLPPANEQIQATVTEQLQAMANRRGSAANGKVIFNKQCASCHQVNGQGTLVGPQLDGIGSRGRERLVEDVLAPHRNVDVAFKTTIITLVDGRIISGLVRRTEGETLVLVDQKGKEFTVATSNIEEQQGSRTSLMPDNFSTTLDLATRTDLFSYLESLKKQ